MSESVAARRYAEALFQIGNEKASIDSFVKELRILREVFQDNKQLYTFLKHPRIDNKRKQQFLEEVLQGLETDIINTIKILVERDRTEIIPSISDHLIQMVNDAKEIAEAKVYSVRKLSDKEIEGLQHNFAKLLNKQTIEFENIIDPTLIGGLKIRVGNTVFDGTINGKIKRIERSIVTANK